MEVKESLQNHLIKLLSQEEKFCFEGVLKKNTLLEATLKYDKKLLLILLEDQKIKSYFFEKIEDNWIFKANEFQQFIQQKEFLPDSFTAFKNKIGLTSQETFLSKSQEVVLNFPYKDCLLEGGQSKEEQKTQEKFWNFILAPEEIDQLLSPKVFTNWTRYDEQGEDKINEISENENYVFKGNNLLVLHSLRKRFQGKIKLIYIDPPYNTRNDSFQYNDSFSHSTWLVFMKNRLEIAWQLLNEMGAIFIQIDDNEYPYLKILCDEIFGRKNFREAIVLKSSTESGVNAINVKRGERLFKVKEYILFYAKSEQFRFKPFLTKTNFNFNYRYEVIKNENTFQVSNLYETIYKKILKENPTEEGKYLAQKKLENYCLENPENIYSLEKNIKKAGEKFKQFAQKNKEKNIIEPYQKSNGEEILVFQGGSLIPLKERIVEENGKNYFGVWASDLWVDIPTTPATEGGIKFSNGKKPEKLLSRIIQMTTDANDIVLDYHLGSGTTAAVAMKLNRRFIGIEQLDYGENDSLVRLQNVIKGEKSGISKQVNWQGGGSFIKAELMLVEKSIFDVLENPTISKEEILVILEKILYSFHRNYQIENPQEVLNQTQKLELNDLKQFIFEAIDLNRLFIPYHSLEDGDYQIDDYTKKMNKTFYAKIGELS